MNSEWFKPNRVEDVADVLFCTPSAQAKRFACGLGFPDIRCVLSRGSPSRSKLGRVISGELFQRLEGFRGRRTIVELLNDEAIPILFLAHVRRKHLL